MYAHLSTFSVAEVTVLMATVANDVPLTKTKLDEPATQANDSELESGNEDELFGDGDTDIESDSEEDLPPKNVSKKMRAEVRQRFQGRLLFTHVLQQRAAFCRDNNNKTDDPHADKTTGKASSNTGPNTLTSVMKANLF
jgi:hypothetical protein